MQEFYPYVQHPSVQQYPLVLQRKQARVSRYKARPAMSDPIELLKQPLTFPFSGRTARNRFLKSAMSERLATFSTFDPSGRGRPTEELVRLYETWAKGDIGNSHLILYHA